MGSEMCIRDSVSVKPKALQQADDGRTHPLGEAHGRELVTATRTRRAFAAGHGRVRGRGAGGGNRRT